MIKIEETVIKRNINIYLNIRFDCPKSLNECSGRFNFTSTEKVETVLFKVKKNADKDLIN